MNQAIPLSLYIHMPWCIHKCAYCDFNSHQARPDLDEQRYIDALLADLRFELSQTPPRPLHSMFIGGGTPSLFSGRAIKRLLDGIFDLFDLEEDFESSIEANPGTTDADNFHHYHQAGINRISIGVQTFDNHALKALERIHTSQAAVEAVGIARNAGFRRINLDLMYGLPDQSVGAAPADLQQAIELGVEHISRYQLTLEPGTRLSRNPPQLPDDDLIFDMEQQGDLLFEKAGFAGYEVSAYARENEASRHNLNYWNFGDYIGIGAGASGKITDENTIRRSRRLAAPDRYLIHAGSSAAVPESRILGEREITADFMLNALRLNAGFARELFQLRTGLSIERIEPALALAEQQQLLQLTANHIHPTELGRRFLNNLIEIFLD